MFTQTKKLGKKHETRYFRKPHLYKNIAIYSVHAKLFDIFLREHAFTGVCFMFRLLRNCKLCIFSTYQTNYSMFRLPFCVKLMVEYIIKKRAMFCTFFQMYVCTCTSWDRDTILKFYPHRDIHLIDIRTHYNKYSVYT